MLFSCQKDSPLLWKPTLLWGRWTETTLVKWKYWHCIHQERALRGSSCSLVCVRNAPGLLTMQWGAYLMVRRHTLLLPSALFPWSQFTGCSQPGCRQSFPSTQRLSGWSTTPLFPPPGISQACWDSRSLMYLYFLAAFQESLLSIERDLFFIFQVNLSIGYYYTACLFVEIVSLFPFPSNAFSQNARPLLPKISAR